MTATIFLSDGFTIKSWPSIVSKSYDRSQNAPPSFFRAVGNVVSSSVKLQPVTAKAASEVPAPVGENKREGTGNHLPGRRRWPLSGLLPQPVCSDAFSDARWSGSAKRASTLAETQQ
jgi:hypothetical protein